MPKVYGGHYLSSVLERYVYNEHTTKNKIKDVKNVRELVRKGPKLSIKIHEK